MNIKNCRNYTLFIITIFIIGCYDANIYNGKAKLNTSSDDMTGVINSAIGIKSEGYVQIEFEIEKINPQTSSYGINILGIPVNTQSNEQYGNVACHVEFSPDNSNIQNNFQVSYSITQFGEHHHDNILYEEAITVMPSKNNKLGCEYYKDGDDLIVSLYLNNVLKLSRKYIAEDGMHPEDGYVGFGGVSLMNIINIVNFKYFPVIPFQRQAPIYIDS